MTIILAIVLLCILITVHEFGHFVAARLTGIPVVEFAIGMGPKMLSWKSKKYDTKFSLRVIPVGGYCAFTGEDDVSEEHKDNPDAYQNHAVWKRLLTVLMGPIMNFVLAFIVAVGFFALTPFRVSTPIENSTYISSVAAGEPAQMAGIQAGDQITQVGSIAVDLNDPSALVAAIKEAAAVSIPFDVTVKRGDTTFVLPLSPALQNDSYRIGVEIRVAYSEGDPYRLNFAESIKEAFQACIDAGGAVFSAIKMIFTREASLGDLSGPVGIVSMISEQTQTYGAQGYVSLLIMISINLGIMNLLPIPGLDGSRIIFMLVEAIRHKPIDQKKEAMVHLGGYLVLFGLFLLITYKDIARLFMGG